MELRNNDIPSMDNYYNSTYWENNKNKDIIEKTKLSNLNSSDMFNNYTSIDNSFTSLTGEEINMDVFKHNNMQRFISKSVTQNMNTKNFISNNNNGELFKNKREVETENFFTPQIDMDLINGSKFDSKYMKNRAESSLTQINNNVFPIEPVKVGPGMDDGYTNSGSGGFHNYYSSIYSTPKNVDELRSKNNQKEKTFNIDYQAPKINTAQRGIVESLDKNRPEKSFKISEDNWFKTTGANLKQSKRPIQNIKATNKQDSHIEYKGGVNYLKPGIGTDDNYGKDNILIYDNERQTTEDNSNNITNITSIVKAVVAPILDAVKITNKEHTISSSRETGNIKGNVEKPTLYDPINHITKTTIKETTIHDSQNTNLTGPSETYSALTDDFKTTVKETTIHDSQNTNLTGPNETYSALTDNVKTTVKETTIHDSQNTNFKGDIIVSYVTHDDNMKTTVKETVPQIDIVRNIGPISYSTYVYDVDSIAKTTVKETTIKSKSEYGFLGGLLNNLVGGYFNKDIKLNNTNKQFTSEKSSSGYISAITDHRQSSRKSYYDTEFDDTRENILIAAGHTPNPGNMNINIDSKDVNMKVNKNNVQNKDREYGNVGKIYHDNLPIDNIKSSITKDKNVDINAFENRLDGSLMDALKTNQLNIEINPIV